MFIGADIQLSVLLLFCSSTSSFGYLIQEFPQESKINETSQLIELVPLRS